MAHTPEQLADVLRHDIRDHTARPGDLLIQEELARRFGVSRNPVREALRTLAAEGLVELVPGGRATVRRLTVEDLREIYDLRLALEPLLAPWVVDEARGRDVDALRAAASAMAGVEAPTEWLRENFAFHTAMYRTAGRPHTESVLTRLLTLTQPYSADHVTRLGGRAVADDEHARMVDAVAARDAEALAGLIRTHLSTARDRLIAQWPAEDPARQASATRA